MYSYVPNCMGSLEVLPLLYMNYNPAFKILVMLSQISSIFSIKAYQIYSGNSVKCSYLLFMRFSKNFKELYLIHKFKIAYLDSKIGLGSFPMLLLFLFLPPFYQLLFLKNVQNLSNRGPLVINAP